MRSAIIKSSRNRWLMSVVAMGIAVPIVGLVAPAAHAVDPVCWAVDDDVSAIYTFTPDTANPQPPTVTPLTKVYKGEGMAFRASTNAVALFSDKPSQLWYFDLATKTETQVGANLPGHVDGAAFWVDPADPTIEQLWVIIGARLYRINPDTAAVISGPHVIAGIGGSAGGLGFEPTLGTLWATDDRPESVLYSIDLATFVATKVADIRFSDGLKPDAESFDFAADGQMYTEEDEGDKKGQRYIHEINPATGLVTPAAGPVPGIGDIEGLACNGGRNIFQPPGRPEIDIEKWVNDNDADTAPGIEVLEKSTVTFLYRVTNTGNVDLFDVTVADDRGVAVVCPSGSNVIGDLAVGASVDCTGSGVATLGQYTNIGSVTGHGRPPTLPDGTPGEPQQVTDSDPANYFGVPEVVVEPPTTPPTTVPATDPTTVPSTLPTTVATSIEATIPTTAPRTTTTIDLSQELPETGRPTVAFVILGFGLVMLGISTRGLVRRPARRS